MNIDIAQDEQVHYAVPMLNVPLSQPISFEVAKADIDHMRAEAAGLQIAGPDDKAGFKTVYDLRQVIKRQRVAVKKRQDELKRPHIDYNREVDQLAKDLTEPMEEIENGLSLKEKAYNDERERIAREKALFLQKRTEGRINQLRAIGYEWNPATESYSRFYYVDDEEKTDVINFDDIKEMEDEEYAPILTDAQAIHEAEQARLAEEKRRYKEEQERIKAEQQAEAARIAAERKKLDEERAELRRKEEELAEQQAKARREADRIAREKYDQEVHEEQQRLKEEEQARWEAEQKRLEKEQEAAEKAQRRANRERQKRLAPDKKTIVAFLGRSKVQIFPNMTALQPEAASLLSEFKAEFLQLIERYQVKIDEL